MNTTENIRFIGEHSGDGDWTDELINSVDVKHHFPIPADEIWKQSKQIKAGAKCTIAWVFDRKSEVNVSIGRVTRTHSNLLTCKLVDHRFLLISITHMSRRGGGPASRRAGRKGRITDPNHYSSSGKKISSSQLSVRQFHSLRLSSPPCLERPNPFQLGQAMYPSENVRQLLRKSWNERPTF